MTQRIVVLLGCDVEGGIETPNVKTVSYKLDGVEHEIELCPKHRAVLESFNDHARVIGGAKRSVASKSGKEERAQIRRWAQQNSLPVSNTGRIPESTVAAYRKAIQQGD